MFDELNKALKGLNDSQRLVMKGQEQKFIMWLSEMCLRYKKKPEEVASVVENVMKALQKEKKQEPNF